LLGVTVIAVPAPVKPLELTVKSLESRPVTGSLKVRSYLTSEALVGDTVVGSTTKDETLGPPLTANDVVPKSIASNVTGTAEKKKKSRCVGSAGKLGTRFKVPA